MTDSNKPQEGDTTINSELGKILDDVYGVGYRMAGLHSVGDGSNTLTSDTLYKAKQALTNLIAQEANKAVYGFHEYIMGMNIIRDETDQAFNYARLHRALDDYIAQLTADKEQADE